jgi:hypothetical protein
VAKKKAYEVIQTFRDKENLEIYSVGDLYDAGDAKRVKDLQLKGFLGEEVKENSEGGSDESGGVE